MKTLLKLCFGLLVFAPAAWSQGINYTSRFVLPQCDHYGNEITAGCPGYTPQFYSYTPYFTPTFKKFIVNQFPTPILNSAVDEPGVNKFHMDTQAMLAGQAKFMNQVDTQIAAQAQIQKCLPKVLGVNDPMSACDTSVQPVIRTLAAVVMPQAPVVDETVQKDLDSCMPHEVKVPGSGTYGSKFFEKIVEAKNTDPLTLFGVSSDFDSSVSPDERGIIVSKSTDGGKSWASVAQVKKPNYNESDGLYNSLNVTPDGSSIVVTTQKGAFPIPSSSPLDGPIETSGPNKGQLKAALETKINGKGDEMVVSYGFFDQAPELWVYKREGSNWVKKEVLTLPDQAKKSQNLSIEYDPNNPNNSKSIYIGTGDQAFHLNSDSKTFSPIAGVRTDSAVRGMYATKDGVYMATCWGAYRPSAKKDAVIPMHSKSFVWSGTQDSLGTKIRSYSIEADPDPSRSNHLVMTASTGVYFSKDAGSTWSKISKITQNDPVTHRPAEFRTSHFNPDGSVIVSGPIGTFLTNPFSDSCKSK